MYAKIDENVPSAINHMSYMKKWISMRHIWKMTTIWPTQWIWQVLFRSNDDRNYEDSAGSFSIVLGTAHCISYTYCLSSIWCVCIVKKLKLSQLSCEISARKSNTYVNYPVTNWHCAVVTDINHFQIFFSSIFIFRFHFYSLFSFPNVFYLHILFAIELSGINLKFSTYYFTYELMINGNHFQTNFRPSLCALCTPSTFNHHICMFRCNVRNMFAV